MLNKMYMGALHMFDKYPVIKRAYYHIAVSCTNHGITPPLSAKAETVEEGWKDQTPGDLCRNPDLYIKNDESIELMFMDILPFLKKEAEILEIGCNVGRNLHYLYSKGFRRLTGIEIGIKAEEGMKEHFPDAYKSTRYILGNAYESLVKLPTSHYDLVFTHSVLVNIAPKWNGIFKEISRVSKGYVLTMESEGSYTAYPRDFKKMFKRVGYKQILYKFYNLREEKRILASKFDKNEMLKNNTLRLFVPVKGIAL